MHANPSEPACRCTFGLDETRPRNQRAALTAFELGSRGVPHTVIADNLGGLLMQRGEVDVVLVGSDRTTSAGDVCNKPVPQLVRPQRKVQQGARRIEDRPLRRIIHGSSDDSRAGAEPEGTSRRGDEIAAPKPFGVR